MRDNGRVRRGPVPSPPDLVRVECYAGYRGEQEPRRFHTESEMVELDEIIDRWQGPAHRYFKVRDRDGAVHLLRHDEISGCWVRIRGPREDRAGDSG